jgi:hypothetical protein
VTAQALVASTRMPAPDSVMAIPAWAAAVMVCVGVNEMVAVVCVALTEEASVIARPLITDIKNMAGTATPATVPTGAKPAPAPNVDIVEVVAAAAATGVVRPVTTHTTAAPDKSRGVPRTICKLGEEYVAVIVPEMAVPALVHVAVGLLPVKEVKPVTVITAAAVADDAPVNPRVMEEAAETILLENSTTG